MPVERDSNWVDRLPDETLLDCGQAAKMTSLQLMIAMIGEIRRLRVQVSELTSLVKRLKTDA